jgi:hypothetical protein
MFLLKNAAFVLMAAVLSACSGEGNQRNIATDNINRPNNSTNNSSNGPSSVYNGYPGTNSPVTRSTPNYNVNSVQNTNGGVLRNSNYSVINGKPPVTPRRETVNANIPIRKITRYDRITNANNLPARRTNGNY